MKVSSLHAQPAHRAGSLIEVCLENLAKSNKLKLADSHRIFHSRQALFLAGERFEGLYILRSGSAKSFMTSVSGDEHITRFFYPGDIIGVDGFDEDVYQENVQFLETSSVWLINEHEIDNLVKTSDEFRHCLLQSMSHSSVNDSTMMMCLTSCSSEQKIAHFILELSAQFSSLGLSGTRLLLSMTRTDIANYMGMAPETVSRILASFQLKQFIHIHNRQLTIVNYDALQSFVPKNRSPQAMERYYERI